MKLLVTAGPTREPLDPVRFLSNRSTGRMGCAIATCAVERGHEVKLVAGPISVVAPAGVDVCRVTTAVEMLDAVRQRISWCDVLVMAAAVADWRPAGYSRKKLKKDDMTGVLQLERTEDILSAVGRLKEHRLFVGFAAETGDLVSEARKKLAGKKLDLIVANEVGKPGTGFESETNKAVLVDRWSENDLPVMSKTDLAERILEWVENNGSLA